MDQRLELAAREGDIDTLYSLIKEDAHVLDHVDEVPFINTPLHIAAFAGHIYFALEIMRLKPSYARKPNQDGYSPIHLALQNGQTQMVLRLLEMDRDLVRVQGREGKTPLHFAAECGMSDVLAAFLSVCPKSIQDLTMRKETALHIAVKNDQLDALKVLLGWLEHVDKDVVTKLTYDEGNTVLQVATSKNQIEMVRLLIGRVDINVKNSAGLTALDMLETQRHLASDKLRRMLLRGGALKGSSLPCIPTLADSLKTKLSWTEKCLVTDYRKKLYMSNDDRNTRLIVVVLFATANYEAVLSGPQIYDNMTFILFSVINNIAFFASMLEIYLHLPKGSVVLQLVLILVNVLVICTLSWEFLLAATAFLLLVYYSKMVVFLHKFIPMAVSKKSMEVKRSMFKHCRSLHRELTA